MKKYAKATIASGIFFLLFASGCDHSNDPKWNPDFQKMEIHYSKAGGWIVPTKLDIYGNGTVIAYSFNQNADSVLAVLDEKEQDQIEWLFKSFSSYDRYYEPKPEDWVTDQNTYMIIFLYDGIPDTVSVYMPEKADIPLSLTKIIVEMEALWAEVLGVD
jgi:hypothetical protein